MIGELCFWKVFFLCLHKSGFRLRNLALKLEKFISILSWFVNIWVTSIHAELLSTVFRNQQFGLLNKSNSYCIEISKLTICFTACLVHTMDELKLTGNSLKGSRPILSFDQVRANVYCRIVLNLQGRGLESTMWSNLFLMYFQALSKPGYGQRDVSSGLWNGPLSPY